MNEASTADSIELTSDIVSAYVTRNSVPVTELPNLIASVHEALSGLGKPAEIPVEDHRATPAQIKKSITPDALISFVDGKPYKSLKRHLAKHDLTPYDYRTKYGLPSTYPMVSESYSAQRSELAKSLGLGQIRRDRVAAAKAAAPDATKKGAAKRGRPKSGAAE